jgi:hypothetical protein
MPQDQERQLQALHLTNSSVHCSSTSLGNMVNTNCNQAAWLALRRPEVQIYAVISLDTTFALLVSLWSEAGAVP